MLNIQFFQKECIKFYIKYLPILHHNYLPLLDVNKIIVIKYFNCGLQLLYYYYNI